MIKKSFLIMLLSVFSLAATSQDQAPNLLGKMTKAIRTLNFNTSFVVVKNNQAEPYHWVHGITEDGQEFELLSQLNGPRRDLIRKDHVVSYLEPEFPQPYSVNSHFISGPIPDVFFKDTQVLLDEYDILPLGKTRILGLAAQGIRIIPKDNFRFAYHVWLEQESQLLLKLAVVNRKGLMLEQIQFTYLEITDDIPHVLKQITQLELPKPMQHMNDDDQLGWDLVWLPKGFQKMSTSRHRLIQSDKNVEYRLYSDGLVDLSVYVNASEINKRKAQFTRDGATLAFNQIVNNVEISVVGDIPLKTAEAITNSIQFKQAR